MSILKSDIDELRRLVTNTSLIYHENDKKFLNRVIAGIAEMEIEIVRLKEVALVEWESDEEQEYEVI